MDMLAVAVLALELVDITEVERSLRAVSHTDGLSPLWETYQTYQTPEVPFFLGTTIDTASCGAMLSPHLGNTSILESILVITRIESGRPMFESHTMDWKSEFIRELRKTFVAFANSDGGTVLIR